MGNTILIVDDERNFRTGLQLFLEENGYTVNQAATGSEALVQLRENSYHAVLLDLLLPDIEGIELAEYITLNHPDTAVIILTGNGSMNTAIRAVRYGVVDYLQKPCRPELLLQILVRGIENNRLKKELIASRYSFEQLAAATWEGIGFFSGERLTQCNPQFRELFGIRQPDSDFSHSLKEFIRDSQACLALVQQCPAGEPTIFETIGISTGTASFPLEMRIRRMQEDNGQLCWVAAFRDISVRKHAEMSRLKMQEELTNAQRMESIGLMAGSVAHDLNNILTAIVTFPELLLMKMGDTEKYRKEITLIRKAGKQAAAVVADLLTVTRGATGKKEPCDLNEMIDSYRESQDFYQVTREHPTADINFRLRPHLDAIEGSAIHLHQTLINLVTNAIEAAGSEGHVIITTEHRCLQSIREGYEIIPPGSYAVLSVRDSGTGIAAGDLPRLFEPFFSRKKLGRSGTGLGLTVIWNTVRDHHGYIDIHSNSRGSCFELYFPTSQKISCQAPYDGYTPPPIGNGEKVLVVDDEGDQRGITAALLKRLGYTPLTAEDGQAALEYLRREPVDLLLLDLWMEHGINGHETYREALQIRPDQKAILASGYFRPEDKITSQSMGIRHRLTKPYSIQSLANALQDELHDPT